MVPMSPLFFQTHAIISKLIATLVHYTKIKNNNFKFATSYPAVFKNQFQCHFLYKLFEIIKVCKESKLFISIFTIFKTVALQVY